ncbi:tRNA synthetases class I-domain-containing protein [Endogone sp. FLAS-F59071]|nr:tRNA synthetases class I-domain-containing protein [Endogone sp. FLAS-F59071]|eukprot:RUS21822.1 tRNA synthetases class I-domain-containing protein [Endogone sp. FLAS-F59071]
MVRSSRLLYIPACRPTVAYLATSFSKSLYRRTLLQPVRTNIHPYRTVMSSTTAQNANPTDASGAEKSYSSTLLIPNSAFPLRADAVRREHAFRDRCMTDLYQWQLENNPKDLFVLHDGPPYANGSLHTGHAMNKIVKDIINRYKVLQGYRVHYVPGWDCHGLPIELKALEALKDVDRSQLTPTEIRKAARARALSEVEKQKQDFVSWGVMGDWDNAYKTLDKEFEVRQLMVFHDMDIFTGNINLSIGLLLQSTDRISIVTRKFSSESFYVTIVQLIDGLFFSIRTALAEAELEYKDDHLSRSIYVKFPVIQPTPALVNILPKDAIASSVYALIWTTTPWTIPANKAVAVNPEMVYLLVKSADGSHMVVAKDRLEALREELGTESAVELTKVAEISGSDLIGTTYAHPLTNETMCFIAGAHVTAESGTGLVHTAPGHGMEDYEACRSLGIKPFSPVDDTGHFTADAGVDLAGKFVFTDGNALVIEKLTDRGYLMRERKYKHKYPYDWRTKKPIMLRATAQWFANVEELQQKAVEALKFVRMVPEGSFRRIEQFTLSRKEWCISRQRSWGVPIPVLYDVETGEPLLTDNSVRHIISVIERMGGTDAWWEVEDDEEFVAEEYRGKGRRYRRGYDTMDVWFDSGSSWTLVRDLVGKLGGRDEAKPVADLYLEGSDQHRGWFQSSLLTSIAVTGKSPYSTLITHGFVLDEHGRKMSKSLGNMIEPKLITLGGKDPKQHPPYGTDILRLWVATSEYTHDVTIGRTVMKHVAETMRKIRTTARFMLGSLDGFSEASMAKYTDLKEIDKYMLHELYHFNKMVTEAYEEFSPNKVVQVFYDFTNNTLSAFYFDIVKSRLYADRGPSRENVRSVFFHILNYYTIALAPITCLTAEEIYDHFKANSLAPKQSVFRVGWPQLNEEWNNPNLKLEWDVLKSLKAEVNQVLERARQDKAKFNSRTIRESKEATVEIHLNPKSDAADLLRKHGETELAALFITSDVKILDADPSALANDGAKAVAAQAGLHERRVTLAVGSGQESQFRVVVRATELHKCPRCWNYTALADGGLCERCEEVMRGL